MCLCIHDLHDLIYENPSTRVWKERHATTVVFGKKNKKRPKIYICFQPQTDYRCVPFFPSLVFYMVVSSSLSSLPSFSLPGFASSYCNGVHRHVNCSCWFSVFRFPFCFSLFIHGVSLSLVYSCFLVYTNKNKSRL